MKELPQIKPALYPPFVRILPILRSVILRRLALLLRLLSTRVVPYQQENVVDVQQTSVLAH